MLKDIIDKTVQLAKSGNTDSQCSLGLIYEKGLGVDKNLDQALHWYEKAAFSGHKVARSNYFRLKNLLETDNRKQTFDPGRKQKIPLVLKIIFTTLIIYLAYNIVQLLIDLTNHYAVLGNKILIISTAIGALFGASSRFIPILIGIYGIHKRSSKIRSLLFFYVIQMVLLDGVILDMLIFPDNSFDFIFASTIDWGVIVITLITFGITYFSDSCKKWFNTSQATQLINAKPIYITFITCMIIKMFISFALLMKNYNTNKSLNATSKTLSIQAGSESYVYLGGDDNYNYYLDKTDTTTYKSDGYETWFQIENSSNKQANKLKVLINTNKHIFCFKINNYDCRSNIGYQTYTDNSAIGYATEILKDINLKKHQESGTND